MSAPHTPWTRAHARYAYVSVAYLTVDCAGAPKGRGEWLGNLPGSGDQCPAHCGRQPARRRHGRSGTDGCRLGPGPGAGPGWWRSGRRQRAVQELAARRCPRSPGDKATQRCGPGRRGVDEDDTAIWRFLAGLSVWPCARSARTPRSPPNRPGGAISPYGRMGHGVPLRQRRDEQAAGPAAMRWPAAARSAAGQIERPTCSASLLLPAWKPTPSRPVANWRDLLPH
jgi:hypothetical protein